MAVSAFKIPRTAGSWSVLRFAITGVKAPSTLRVLSLEQPVRIRRTRIPARSPRLRFMEGKCSFLGDTAVARNPIRYRWLPSTRRLWGVGLGAMEMSLRVAQHREKLLRSFA